MTPSPAVRRHPADLVTARALRYGLSGDGPRDRVAEELLALAQGSRHILEWALARVERGLSARSSRVGMRARDVLEHAVTLLCIEAEPFDLGAALAEQPCVSR